jgi:hypothetical protein
MRVNRGEIMPLTGRVLLGCLAIFLAVSLFRACRNRVIFSDGVPCDGNRQPMRFAELALLDVIGIVAFTWLAAGHGVTGLWRLLAAH